MDYHNEQLFTDNVRKTTSAFPHNKLFLTLLACVLLDSGELCINNHK